MPSHLHLFIGNHINEDRVYRYLKEVYPKTKKASWFSKKAIEALILEERIHDLKWFSDSYGQSLERMSSGQQGMAFFKYILSQQKETIVLINPMAHLDATNRRSIEEELDRICGQINLVVVTSNEQWIPKFISQKSYLEYDSALGVQNELFLTELTNSDQKLWRIFQKNDLKKKVPEILVRLENVEVSYGNKKVLHKINWTIKSGDFWQLKGENGSGKTTLLSLITGDNPKGFGQDLWLFGHKKGSGESVWEIKKQLGYYAPSMVQMFPGTHSAIEMILGGVLDQVGLYSVPSEEMTQKARLWLKVVGLSAIDKMPFHALSEGQKGMVMTLRAMIKFPALLILDEPTSGLDSTQSKQYIQLVDTIAKQTNTAIVLVSHIEEHEFKKAKRIVLYKTPQGSVAKII
jgi:molybdate transport system ATP-binding protein